MKTRRIVALLVAMLMLLGVVHPISASVEGVDNLQRIESMPSIDDGDWITHHEVLDVTGAVMERVTEFAGSIFNFRITDDYVYSSQITPYGYYSFGFRDMQSNVVYHETFSLFDAPLISQNVELPRTKDLDSDTLLYISSIVSQLIIGNIDYIETSRIEFAPVEEAVPNVIFENLPYIDSVYEIGGYNYAHFDAFSFAPLVSDRVHPSMQTLIRNEFPASFQNRLVLTGGSTRNGVLASGRMYESYIVSFWEATRWQVRAGQHLTAISALVAIEGTQLSRILSVMLVAGGILVARADAVVGQYWALEDHIRRININGFHFSQASRQTQRHVISGNLGFMLNLTRSPQVWQHPSFFNQTNTLLSRSLDMWHSRGWFLCWYS